MPTIVEPDAERNYVTVLADRSNADIASVDRTMVVERYKIHGAILFRGFELDLASLNSFTSKFCSGISPPRSSHEWSRFFLDYVRPPGLLLKSHPSRDGLARPTNYHQSANQPKSRPRAGRLTFLRH